MTREEIEQLFEQWVAAHPMSPTREFPDWMSAEHNADIVRCVPCLDFVDINEAEAYGVDDEHICEVCRTNGDYHLCGDCDRWGRAYENYYVGAIDRSVCDSCIENYPYCDDCGIHDDHEHNHEDEDDAGQTCPEGRSGGCEALGKDFLVSVGNGHLFPADTRHVFQLPGGMVDEVGRQRIVQLLRDRQYSLELVSTHSTYDERVSLINLQRDINIEAFESTWETREGKYPRRLSRYAFKQYGLKIPAELLEQIGNIARESSASAPTFHFEFTRELNLPARYFSHEDSCWWGGYFSSRCWAKSNGVFGMRTFRPDSDSSDYRNVSGRVWVLPVKEDGHGGLTPTTHTEIGEGKAVGFIVFNGYGDLSAINAARAIAEMHGMAYQRIGFYADPMYVNSERGFIVSTPEITKRYTEVRFSVDAHSDLYTIEHEKGE